VLGFKVLTRLAGGGVQRSRFAAVGCSLGSLLLSSTAALATLVPPAVE